MAPGSRLQTSHQGIKYWWIYNVHKWIMFNISFKMSLIVLSHDITASYPSNLVYYIIWENYVWYQIVPAPVISILQQMKGRGPRDGVLAGYTIKDYGTFTYVMYAHRDPEKDCPNIGVVCTGVQVYSALYRYTISSHTSASWAVGGREREGVI